MVLVIEGLIQEEHPPDSRTLFLKYPSFKEINNQFLSIQPKVIGPACLLYVQQREMAVTMSYDKSINIIGSDDVTTCIIIILRHSGSGAVGLAHLDGNCTEECVINMIHKVQGLSAGVQGRLELHIVGGFSDMHNYSEDLFFGIMHSFHKQSLEIDLKLACVGEYNTVMRNNVRWPIVYGAGVNIKTGEIFPATFVDKGPERPLRIARQLTGGQQVLDVYDCSCGLLKIGPFNYEPLRGVDLWLNQPDEFILQHLSTTPDVEPPHFVNEVKAALKYIQDNPFPAVTVFRDNRPHYYRKDETSGLWIPF